MFYEIKLKRKGINAKGEEKEIKEHFILDAETHGDAETQGYALYEGTEVDVFAVFRSGYYEIVNEKEDDKPFFKATVIDTFTDDNGKEKEIKYAMLVCAADLTQAHDIMKEYLKQGYDNMRLDEIKRTKITDYIKTY